MEQILDLKKIEVRDEFTYPLDKLPIDKYGNMKLEICTSYKYGKLQKIYIYPKYFNGCNLKENVYFEITPLKKNYFNLYDVNVESIHYCKEHKSQTIIGNINCFGKNKFYICILNSMTNFYTS
jgi:hypothetical protein